ncbi:MAG TPA: fatty acid desaturase [Acidimicrobiales bacterium]|nr:fatty acid desaturase [Acidimicrobiales bacterium]
MTSLALAVIVGLAVAQLATLVTTLYLHRTLAHRALTLSPKLVGPLRVLTWITTGIRPRQWVAVHRKHHAFTDVEGDPHSPLLEGFAAVQFGNVALYRRVAADKAVVRRYARDLPADRWDRLFFDHAIPGLAIGVAFLVLLLGFWPGVLAAVIHTVTYLLLNAAVNAVGHCFGVQPQENTARNSQLLAFLTAGEGLHNNHHAAPISARFSLHRGEVDLGWWVVRMLERLHCARVRHHEVKLKQPVAA